MKIIPSTREDAEIIAAVVRNANKDVAETFGLNAKNAAKHPSFCTEAWILSDMERGQAYFLAVEDGVVKGCVAFEQPDRDTAYLNRLAVLPEFRHCGIGAGLVHHIIGMAKEKQVKVLSIGIIARHTQLKEWYLGLGFRAAELLTFDHLPFDVLIMKYQI
ncbi:MAG: GNAT family N-acetyltransferase [Desulfobacter sp.]|nr:MAG: GNAT family N-acetyltransferase [Desulfobacter sp.]